MRITRLASAAVLLVAFFSGNALASESIDLITTTPIRTHGQVKGAAEVAPFDKSASGDVALMAAAWLEGQQKDGMHASPGAFPWTPNDAAVYSNTQGATALGLVRAYQRTGDASILATAVENGDCIVANCITNMTYTDGDHRFATHDPLFLEELSNASGDPSYAALVQAFLWDKFAADSGNGEYGETNDINAAEFGALVLSGRTSQNIPDLAAWDLSEMVIAAHVAGEAAARDAMMPSIVSSLEAADGTFNTYDVLGLAGALWTAASIGVELDPTAGTWAAANNNADLAAALLARQAPNGGFIAGNAQAVIDAETDGQTTSFAMQALAAVDRDLYAAEINAGFAYLASLQQPSGQFLPFSGAALTETGGVETHGEILEAFAVLQLGPDRYVSKTGTDAGTCSTPSSSCLTIQYAVNQAFEGDTIHIDSGTYDQPIVVVTDGLSFVGEGLAQPTMTVGSGATNQIVLSINGAEGVSVTNIRFLVDVSFAGEGIQCSNGCADLTVSDSNFVQIQSAAARSSYGRTNAISAGLVGPHPVPVEVTVTGTTIAGDPGSTFPTQFRAGVAVDYGFGTVGGPNPADGNDIVSVNHDVIFRQHQSGALRIEGNTLRGFGVQYTTPLATAGAVEIIGNSFTPLVAPDSPAFAGDYAAMRLISNSNGIAVNVTGNTFDGHERGVLIENFPGVTLDGNTFTPKAGSGSFSHVVLSNKELFTGTPAQPISQSLALMAINNTFNAGTVAGMGTAIELLNDNAQGAPVGGYYGAVVFGTNGNENNFDGDFGQVFKLDNFSCAASNTAPCQLATLYTNAIGAGPNTPVEPYAGNATAIENFFDGTKPAAMSASQRSQLLARTQDDGADANLGHVDYGFTGGPLVVFVDDDFAGDAYGDAEAFSNSATSNPTVYFGIDAFATISDAIAAVEEDGTVYIADGTYAESPVVAKRLSLIGDGSTATTTIAGPLAITASGVDAMNPLLFSGFVVSNPAGDGLVLSGTVSFLRFEGVAFDGNSANGVNFNGGGNDGITFVGTGLDCRFNGNQIGIRSGTTAVASNVSFDDCDFNGNSRGGIILFGASGSGNGQITDWSVNNSRFIGNDSSDTTGFGGGIWIKTGGAGSAIDGFDVTNSTFEDNGSSNALNQVGITLRARPGTTIANVSICSNSFAETVAGGTQTYGLLVFDDTANGGYQPVTVCDNTFDGPIIGVSGNEQRALRDTQPVVILSGNSTTGGAVERALVNDPVTNLDTMETFATISAAMADVDTLAGHTIEAGVGLYAETVTVSRDNLTLQGVGSATTIYGMGIAASGVSVSNHDGVTIQNLTVSDFTTLPGGGACVYVEGSDDITIDSLLVNNCQGGRAGIYVNGPVDGVTINNNEVTNIGGGGARGIVVWNGFKTNIAITDNNVHDMAGCCGIELQDGTASGVTITGNTVERVGDSGMAFVGLMAGAGANLISGNTITDTGRYGMEVKLPNGTGADVGDGSIVIENNVVSLSGSFAALKPSEERDIAGIAVFRRAYVVGNGNVDIPTGVIVRNNTVSGYVQDNASSDSEGFGIVLEGTLMQATGNTVNNNDVGIQRQQGHLPYTANAAVDGDQSDLVDQYFGRGNSPLTCGTISGNLYSGNGADEREIGGSVIATITNSDTGIGYCTIQSAVDDPLTLDGHTILLSDDLSYAEQVVISKSLRITRNNTGTNAPVIEAPASVSDLALFRAAAPDIEIDHLAFDVDLSVVGEAIRSVGNTVGGEPDGISIHDNTITATASAGAFISYGRRNAISLNMSNPSGYAPPGEQVTTLSVDVQNNVIGGTQDWDAGTGGNQPAYFRAALAIDQGEGVIDGNTLRGRDYDVFARFTNGAAGLDIGLAGTGNTLAGGGLYVGDGIQPVRVTDNLFTPDRSLLPFADFPGPFGALQWGDMGFTGARLVNISDSVTLEGNTFSDHTNAVFAQNFVDLDLIGNVFNAPSHGTEFRHLILSTKVLSSGSASVTQVPLAIDAIGNTFNGSGSQQAIAVDLVNHDADNAQYASLNFGGSLMAERNSFVGNFDFYFHLDPTSCTPSNTCAPEPYLTFYQYGGIPATDIAPFGGDVDAPNNLFDGLLPSAMNFAQVSDLQARTYHDDPNAPEMPAAPAALGIVNYGFAANTIPTTTTVVSTSPNPSAIGADVTVTVNVVNDLDGVPAGSILVTAPGTAGCSIPNYPTANSCVLSGGFAAGGQVTVTANFTAADPVNQDSNGAAIHTVTFAGGTTVPVVPAPVPTPTDNDYTRINNAVQAAGSGVIIELTGDFDWTEPNAYASWELGSDGILGTDDDWSSKLPAGMSGATVRATALGNASIQGNEGTDADDFAAFLYAGGSVNQGWTFENLTVRGFDIAFAMFGNGAEDLNGTQYLNNRIEMGPDSGDDYANYGIYSGFGEQQTVAGNEIVMDITGADGSNGPGPNSRSVAIQIGDSCNGDCFDGLLVSSNTISVTGVPAANPPRLLGLWENAGDGNSSIQIEDNVFTGSGDLGTGVENNNQTGIIATTQSNGARQSAMRRNMVSGAAFGFRSQLPTYGHYVNSDSPLLIESNTFTGNGTALHLQAAYPNAGQYDIQFNRIAGNGIGLFAERADDLPLPGAPGYGGDELPTVVDADDNWWGCNAGPADSDCDSVVIEAGADPAVVTQDTWLQLRAIANPTVVVPPNPSAITVDLVSSFDGTTVATVFPEATAIGLITSKASFNPPAPFATASGAIATSLEGLNSGIALMTATLDNQDVDFNVSVAGPVTVNDDLLGTHVDGRATCPTPDFSTIQDAVDTMPAGSEILVCSGQYIENVVITQPVLLMGAQAGVDARSRADTDAAIIVPAVGDPSLDDATLGTAAVFDISSDDVSVDGFLIDGDNPAISTGFDLNGADPDVDSGLFATGSNIHIDNNVIRNVSGAGLYGYSGGSGDGDNTVRFNRLENITAPSRWGIGVISADNWYARIDDNLMNEVRVGVQTNNTYAANPGALAASISNNEIHAARIGIFHNLFYNNASMWTLDGNTFIGVDNPAQSGRWAGIWVESMGGSQTVVLSNNDISAAAIAGRTRLGYELNNWTSSQSASTTIQGGTLSDLDTGILATDGTYYTGPVNDVRIAGVQFADMTFAAVQVEDTAEVVGGARVTLAAGNGFTNVPYELALAGPLATVGLDGISGVQTTFVRSAGNYYYGLPNNASTVLTHEPGIINTGVAATAVAGTVTLEAGTFAQNALLNRSVTLEGPFVGTPGPDGSRDGTGEAIILPATGVALTLTAPDVVVDGITLDGSPAGGHAVILTGSTADNLQFVNNRVVDVINGSGISSEPGADCTADGFLISGNLFSAISGGGAANGRGIRLGNGHCSVEISDNTFDTMLYAINANGGNGSIQDLTIADNQIQNTTGTALVLTNTTRTLVERNSVTAVSGGLFISDKMTDFTASCNVFSASGNGVSTFDFFGGTPNVNVRIFDNAISGTGSDLNSSIAQGLVVGSNWYDGAAPLLNPGAVNLQAADPLAADPTNGGAFDVGACGDNTPVAMVLYPANGTPQSTDLNQPFANPLRSRVQDALGGAVMGETVSVIAPGVGASALLTAAAGNGSLPMLTTDYNGVAEVTAIANGFAGTYDVTATHSSNSLAFELTNVALSQVQFDLNGPVGGVEVGDEVAYTGYIANENPDVVENVYIHLVASADSTLDPADLALCVIDPMLPSNCIPLTWTDDGATLSLDFTDLSGFPITAPYQFLHNFRAVFGKAGLFMTTAQVVGASSGTIYASDTLSTEVIAQHAGITLDLNGPIAGVEKDVPTDYSASLSNTAADVADNVVVEFVLTRIGGIAAGDVTVEYDTGGGSFSPIPLVDMGGQLVGVFGPGSGFPLPSGYDATTPLRVTYHVAPDTFTVMATVIDAAGDTDGVPTYAADNLSTEVIESDPDVTLVLSGPFDDADGTTPLAALAAERVLLRGELTNDGGNVADMIQASFSIGSNVGALVAADVDAEYWYVMPGDACPPTPAMPESVVFTENAGNLEAATTAQALAENSATSICVAITFHRAGVYSIGGVIEDAVTDTDGLATYAGDNLALTVVKNLASIALGDLGPIVYDGNDHAATATVTRISNGDALPGVGVDITYNGFPTLPNGAGSYAVLATVNSPNWEGSATGTLIITKAPVTVSFSNLSQVYDGGPHAASVSPTPSVGGIQLGYVPNPPVNVGLYAVTATLDDPNYQLTGTVSDTLEITAAASAVGVSAVSVTYDGQPHAAAISNPGGEQISVSYAGTSAGGDPYGPTTVPPTNAGNYVATVTVTDPNYSGGPFNGNVDITPQSTDVALSNLSQTYDGSAKPAAAVASVPAAPLLLEYDGGAAAPINAGSYSVLVSSLSENYVLGTVTPSNPATLEIAKAPVIINFTALNFVSSGSPQPAQFVATPTPGVGNDIVCVDVYTPGPSAPVDPGMYSVSVTCDGTNYSGSALATVNITNSPVGTLELVGSDSFNGIAGAALPAPGPTVLVRDGNGDPVQGASVQFQITAGNGSIASGGTVVATDVNGQAEVGAWTLGRDASASNGLSATIVGRADIAAVTFSATGAEQADMAIDKTSGTTALRTGDSVDYLITVTNAGPSNATSVDVLDVLPAELNAATASWVCIPGGGASCGTASGSGDVSLNGVVPVGGSLTILLSATVLVDSGSPGIDNTAVVQLLSGVEVDNADNESTYSISYLPPLDPEIFKDGFEGSAVPFAPVSGDGATAFVPDWGSLVDSAAPVKLLSMPAGDGSTGFEVFGFRSGDKRWIRLGGTDVSGLSKRSGWTQVPSGALTISWIRAKSTVVYRAAADDFNLMLALPGTSSPRVGKAMSGARID